MQGAETGKERGGDQRLAAVATLRLGEPLFLLLLLHGRDVGPVKDNTMGRLPQNKDMERSMEFKLPKRNAADTFSSVRRDPLTRFMILIRFSRQERDLGFLAPPVSEES